VFRQPSVVWAVIERCKLRLARPCGATWFTIALAASCILLASATPSAAEPPAPSPYIRISSNRLVDIVKYFGCTFGNLLSNHSGIEELPDQESGRPTLFNNYVDLFSHSKCVYLNRAIDTWNTPPDFPAITANIEALTARSSKPYVLGEFIAESVTLTQVYADPVDGRNFDFSQMCKTAPAASDTQCTPSFDRPEFQRYVAYIAKKSIDIGFQVFLLGGVGLTDNKGTNGNSGLLKVIRQTRAYAAERGITVIFVAQNPSTFGGRAYLENFDLIQGGAYTNADGSLPGALNVTNKGAANTYSPGRLWLAREIDGTPYYDLHKLVIEYDWFGSPLDDSSEIACLSVKSQIYLDHVRAESSENCPLGRLVGSALPTIETTYDYFKSLGIGFWLPARQPIGFAPWLYTPLNHDLYQNDPRYAVNFDDEQILSLGEMK
jgi:hypothetical protein